MRGYRYGRGYTLLRKRTLLRLKRTLARYYKRRRAGFRTAAGLLSRIGQLCHCSSTGVMRRIYRKGTQRHLKNLIRRHAREEQYKWSMCSA